MSSRNVSPLDSAITRYKEIVENIESANTNPNFKQIIEVLIARDEVEKNQNGDQEVRSQNIVDLIDLDKRLKEQAKKIHKNKQLINYRQNLQSSELGWWWFMEPTPPWWARGDWIWNFFTVIFLVITGTYITNTAKTFSQEDGFDFAQTITTVAQGTGLLLVSGGVLTNRGQQQVKKILSSLRIPSYLHPEATFVGSVVLLVTAQQINTNLPDFAETYYYQNAERLVKNGELLDGINNYEQAIKLSDSLDNKAKSSLNQGKAYEQLGKLDNAQKNYTFARSVDDYEATIRLAKVILLQELQRVGWTGEIKSEQAAPIKQAEIYLNLANYNKEEKTQPDTVKDTVKELPAIEKELYISYGILFWSEMNLQPSQQASSCQQNSLQTDFKNTYKFANQVRETLLESRRWDEEEFRLWCLSYQAALAFKKAADLEYTLPTSLTGRRADCYHKIATYEMLVRYEIKLGTEQTEKKKEVDEKKKEVDSCYPILKVRKATNSSELLLMDTKITHINNLRSQFKSR